MLFILAWLYTLFLIFIWGFFIIAKLHSYKFKNFSTQIIPVTRILLIFLVVLSICGYILIFFTPVTLPETANVFDSLDTKWGSTANDILPIESRTPPTKSDYEDIDFNEINY